MATLVYPEIVASVGNYELTQGFHIEIVSSQDAPYDYGQLRFLKALRDQLVIQEQDKVYIEAGYDGELEDIFSGSITIPDQEEVMFKDDMILLDDVTITETFLSVVPQEVIEYSLKQAGIEKYHLSSKAYPQKEVVVIAESQFLDVVGIVHELWGIKEPAFFYKDTFYWGTYEDDSKSYYQFEYGDNIINLYYDDGLWELETILMPIRHSQTIAVKHPDLEGDFEVKKVVTVMNDKGARTKLYFRSE